MASSITLKTSDYSGRYMQVTCTQTKDNENNCSIINWALSSIGGSKNYYDTGATKLVINGSTVYEKERVSWNSYAFPAAKGSVNGKLTVYHDTKGEASITVKLTTAIYTYTERIASSTWTLDSIPRRATILTAPDFTDEQTSLTITYENYASAAAQLSACISLDGSNADIAYRDIAVNGNEYTFTLTNADMDILRAATATSNSRAVYFYIRTIEEGQYYFDKKKVTFSVVNAQPILNPSMTDMNETTLALTGGGNRFIRGVNELAYNIAAQAQKGATIVSQSVTCGTGAPLTEPIGRFFNVDNNIFTFSATDSRGNTTTKTLELVMVDYIKPTVSQTVEMAIDGEGAKIELTAEGDFFNGSFGAVENELILQVRHTQNNGDMGDWVTLTEGLVPIIDGNTYKLEATVSGLEHNRAYTFQCKIIDSTGSSAESAQYALSLTPVFDWSDTDFNFNVPVSIDGSEICDFVIEEGTAAMGSNGTWHWQKWKNGKAECWGVRNFGNMAITEAWGSDYSSADFEQALPDIFAAAPYVMNIELYSAGGFAWIAKKGAPTADSSGVFIVVRPASYTLSQAYICFHAIGAWK